MKKLLIASFIFFAVAGTTFAQYGCCPGGWRPCGPPYPPPCPGWGWGCGGWRGSEGLYNAAAITSIVANSLGIVRTLSTPTTVVVPTPVYNTSPTQVVVQQQPVGTTPVVVAPVVSDPRVQAVRFGGCYYY